MSGFPELRGRAELVTGGASGIGLGIARRFAAEGMQVVIADAEQDTADRASKETGVPGMRADVRDATDVHALAAATAVDCGGVHVVANHAGVGPDGPDRRAWAGTRCRSSGSSR